MSAAKRSADTMTPREVRTNNDEVVRRMFATIDARQFDVLAEIVDPQVVYERPGYQAYQGVSELLRFYKSVRGIKSGTHHIGAIVSSAHTAMCYGHFTGFQNTGEAIDIGFSELYRFEDNKIAFRRTYFFQPAV